METKIHSTFYSRPTTSTPAASSTVDPKSFKLLNEDKNILSFYAANNNINTQIQQQQPCTSASASALDDANRPSHVSLLGGKYLLFASTTPSQNTTSPSGVRSFQRCINVETREQYTCKVVPRNVSGLSLLAAYHRMEEACEFVCRAHEVVLSPKSFYLIMPFSHSNVHSYLLTKKQLNEREAAKIFKQMVQAVQFCHDKGIVLRDLKMGKFVFADADRTIVKLESLEDSVLLSNLNDDGLSDKHGCPNYVSPEKAESLRSNKTYPGKATDVWGLGVILYTMLVGRYPFNDAENDNNRLFAKIRKGDFMIPNYVSDAAKNLIRNLLNKNPSERFDCSKILKHRWLVDNDNFISYKDSIQRQDSFHERDMPRKEINHDQVVPDFKMIQ
jgi:serine/threonine protein kinase